MTIVAAVSINVPDISVSHTNCSNTFYSYTTITTIYIAFIYLQHHLLPVLVCLFMKYSCLYSIFVFHLMEEINVVYMYFSFSILVPDISMDTWNRELILVVFVVTIRTDIIYSVRITCSNCCLFLLLIYSKLASTLHKFQNTVLLYDIVICEFE